MKRVLVIVAAAILCLGACGDDDDAGVFGDGGDLSAEEQEQADRVAASILADNSPDFGEVTPEQAECVGVGIVRGLGAERTAEIEWEEDDFDGVFYEADAPIVVDAVVTCVDMGRFFAASFSQTGEVSEEEAQCIADDVSDDEMKALLEHSFVKPDASPSTEIAVQLVDAVVECLDIGAIVVEEFAGGGISEESAQCVADAIPRDLLRDVMLAGMTGGDAPDAQAEFSRAVLGAATDCLTDEELELMTGG